MSQVFLSMEVDTHLATRRYMVSPIAIGLMSTLFLGREKRVVLPEPAQHDWSVRIEGSV